MPSVAGSPNDTLEQMLGCCQQLITVLKEEQDLLIHRSQKDWDALLAQKISVLEDLAKLEKSWRLMPQDQSPLGNSQSQLIQQSLVNAFHDIFSINQQNSSLLRHALYYNRSFLSLIQGFVDRNRPQTYEANGKKKLVPIQIMGRKI